MLPSVFGGVGSALGALGVANPAPGSGSWGGGVIMFSEFLCWVALIFAVSQLAAVWMARSRARLQTARDAGLLLCAASLSVLAFADSGPKAVYASHFLPLVTTAAVGLLTAVTAGVRERRMSRNLEVPGPESVALWESVARALTSASSLDRMLLSVGSAMRAATRSTRAVVYKLPGSDPVFVGQTTPDSRADIAAQTDGNLSALAAHASVDPRVAEYQHASVRDDPYSRYGAWGVVPIAHGRQTLCAILLHEPQVPLTGAEAAVTLGEIGQLTGRVVSDWVATASGRVAETLMDSLPRLAESLSRVTRFEQGLAPLASAIASMTDADYVALGWLDRAQSHEDRASMVLTDGRTRDNRRRWPVHDGPTGRVLNMHRPLVTPDLSEIELQDYGDTAPMERRLGYRSRIIVPVRDAGGMIGSITIAHSEPSRYGEDEAALLMAVAGVTGAWLRRLEERTRSARLSEAVRLAALLEENPAFGKSESELLETIRSAVHSTGLTLWRLAPDGMTMQSVAQVGRSEDLAPTNGRKGGDPEITHAPWHRWAMSEQSVRYVNQGDPELLMSQVEAGLTLGARVKTGWIVPIVWGDATLGFLDATETRSPDRCTLGDGERLILTVAARAIARRWAGSTFGPAPHDWDFRVSALNANVINPITGIYGAVDLIRHKQDQLTPESLKYLNLIEQSARRIHKAIRWTLGDLQEEPMPGPRSTETKADVTSHTAAGGLKNRFEPIPAGMIEMPG